MHSKSAPFFELIKARRSGYALKPSSPISNAALQELVETAVTFSPTPYNTQLPRVALVLGDKHRKLWDALWEVNKKTLTRELGLKLKLELVVAKRRELSGCI
jgi:predicted oxidoreductase (fatty acid repression mutant protein)